MKAIILAAGRGSRLRKLTVDKPKCLNIVRGRPIIAWIIDALRGGGVDEIVIVTGYMADRLTEFADRAIYNDGWESANMVSSLLCAAEEFDQTTIVTYSDIIYESKAVRKIIAQKNDAVIMFDPNWRKLWEKRFVDPASDAESFKIDLDLKIVNIGQKVSALAEVQGQYMGLMKFSLPGYRSLIDGLSNHEINILDMTALFNKRISENRGFVLHGCSLEGGWVEIDTPKDLKLANDLVSGSFLPILNSDNI